MFIVEFLICVAVVREIGAWSYPYSEEDAKDAFLQGDAWTAHQYWARDAALKGDWRKSLIHRARSHIVQIRAETLDVKQGIECDPAWVDSLKSHLEVLEEEHKEFCAQIDSLKEPGFFTLADRTGVELYGWHRHMESR